MASVPLDEERFLVTLSSPIPRTASWMLPVGAFVDPGVWNDALRFHWCVIDGRLDAANALSMTALAPCSLYSRSILS